MKSIHIHRKFLKYCLCIGTTLPSQGAFSVFFLSLFTYIFLSLFQLRYFLSLFQLRYFLSLFHLFSSHHILLELRSHHFSAFSWLFLISLCRSFHIVSSVFFFFKLLFVLLSCPPNRNSPRTWSVSSILGLCKDLLSIRHSSHLVQCSCSMKCSSVSLSSLHPTHTSLFLCQEFSSRLRQFILALNHTIDSRLPL